MQHLSFNCFPISPPASKRQDLLIKTARDIHMLSKTQPENQAMLQKIPSWAGGGVKVGNHAGDTA
jgi:hypothetical protein